MVVSVVILIISVIGGLAEWTLYDWLLQLSDYNCTESLVKNEAANASIILEEFLMIMINCVQMP